METLIALHNSAPEERLLELICIRAPRKLRRKNDAERHMNTRFEKISKHYGKQLLCL